MQWSHIKTLFILSFLVLNIYLLFQFISRQQEMDIPELDSSAMNLEEELKAEDITISADANFEVPTLSYISASQKVFKTSELKELNSKKDVEAELSLDGTLLMAALTSPVEVPEDAAEDVTGEMLSDLISPLVLNASDFSFGTWNKDLNIIVFFQQKDGNPIYLNQHAMLTLYLNDKNEITHYTETMVGESEEQGSTALRPPMNAIESLNNNRYLRSGQDITQITYGYYSRIEKENQETQVFAPTYKITVDGEEDYFVNAVESRTYPGDYTTYLVDMLDNNYLEKLSRIPDDDESIAEELVSIIDDKIEPYRSEQE